MTMISTMALNQYLSISRKRKLTMWNTVFLGRRLIYVIQRLLLGTLKTLDWKRRDWKTRDLKSMASVTIFKSKSYEAEIKTVYSGMVAMLKSSVHQGMTASAVAFSYDIRLLC